MGSSSQALSRASSVPLPRWRQATVWPSKVVYSPLQPLRPRPSPASSSCQLFGCRCHCLHLGHVLGLGATAVSLPTPPSDRMSWSISLLTVRLPKIYLLAAFGSICPEHHELRLRG